MDISFEKPTIADAQSLVDLQIRAFHDDARIYPGVEIGGPPGYDSVEQMLDDMTKHPCYKIVCDGRIVGGIVVFDRGNRHLHLDRIFIDPDYHNRGIGTRAMQFIEETYPATLWTLDTPTYAIRNQHFYEKFGYVRGEEFLADEGIMLFAYEKRL
jgi:GNAT superfamily N-acetyltransferase